MTRVRIGGMPVDPLAEAGVVDRVERGWSAGVGGLIVTPNVDIWRSAHRDARCRELIAQADIVVADGTPLVWAARLAGTPLPARVTGSGLAESLCCRASVLDKGVFIIGGGAADTADRAADALRRRYAGLRVVGCVVPPFGFDQDPGAVRTLVGAVARSRADLVLVGLGFPRQERLGRRILAALPAAWVLGCGGGVAMAAGERQRAPEILQRIGAEWVVRLVQEPRRLARRYLVDDAPAAVRLLARSALARYRRASVGVVDDASWQG